MKTKSRRVLIPAVIMLLFSFAILSSASYAWFSISTSVQATGMQLTTTAPSAMIISKNTTDWANVVDVDLKGENGTFFPASSTDGKTFFAVEKGQYVGSDGKGAGISAANIGDLKVTSVEPAGYYAEIPLYIRAVQTSGLETNFDMVLKSFTVGDGSDTDLAKCVRVSVSQVKPNSGTGATGAITLNTDGSIATTGVTDGSAIVYKTNGDTVDPIASVTSSIATLNGSDPAKQASATENTCFDLDYSGINYSTIIVRIWIEGQHPSAVNTLATKNMTISLEFAVKEVTP